MKNKQAPNMKTLTESPTVQSQKTVETFLDLWSSFQIIVII